MVAEIFNMRDMEQVRLQGEEIGTWGGGGLILKHKFYPLNYHIKDINSYYDT